MLLSLAPADARLHEAQRTEPASGIALPLLIHRPDVCCPLPAGIFILDLGQLVVGVIGDQSQNRDESCGILTRGPNDFRSHSDFGSDGFTG